MTQKSFLCFAVTVSLTAFVYAESPRDAKRLFADNCLDCHDSAGKGTEYRLSDSIPDLTSKDWASGRSRSDLYDSILLGKGSEMPAFEDELSESEINSLVTYIYEISGIGTRAEIDATKGKKRSSSKFSKDLQAIRQKWQELAERYRKAASKGL